LCLRLGFFDDASDQSAKSSNVGGAHRTLRPTGSCTTDGPDDPSPDDLPLLNLTPAPVATMDFSSSNSTIDPHFAYFLETWMMTPHNVNEVHQV
jgi:hypothetical protein